MKQVYAACLLLLCISVSAKVLYKTIKVDGTVVYSDIAVPNSTQVNLSSVNNVVMPALNDAATKSKQKKTRKREKNTQYIVSILSPSNEESVRSNAGTVVIRAQVSPNKAGRFQLVMDGQLLVTQASPIFELEEINRGAHEVEVNFIDNSGKILASSQSQTFYLHKASALINAN